jgi:pimeloyl-ACP methyl ester carboxylesterase
MLLPAQTQAHAVYTGGSGSLTPGQLHSETHMASVGAGAAGITVLTHGLGGHAGHWSNDLKTDASGKFGGETNLAYDPVSIIEKIRGNTLGGVGIRLFVAKTNAAMWNITDEFSLYEYTVNKALNPIAYNLPVYRTTITDFSQHTVIVIDSPDNVLKTHKQLYDELHYIIDKISYDYYAWCGILPRINLIGHSRGGLINMDYAINHPKNVASIISLGTPYNGSWYDNWLVEMLGITDFSSTGGMCITGECSCSYYFCNLNTRRSTWNNTYAQNPHINFHAVSGTTSFTLAHKLIWGDYIKTYVNPAVSIAAQTAYVLMFAPATWVTLMLTDPVVLPGDVCVNKSSQEAQGYNGVNRYNKNFTAENSNLDKRSVNHFPIPHNLQTYDADIHGYILGNMEFGYGFKSGGGSGGGGQNPLLPPGIGGWEHLIHGEEDDGS